MNKFELHVCMDPSNPFMNKFDSKAFMAMGFLYFSEYFNNDAMAMEKALRNDSIHSKTSSNECVFHLCMALGFFYVGYFPLLSRSLCFHANWHWKEDILYESIPLKTSHTIIRYEWNRSLWNHFLETLETFLSVNSLSIINPSLFISSLIHIFLGRAWWIKENKSPIGFNPFKKLHEWIRVTFL